MRRSEQAAGFTTIEMLIAGVLMSAVVGSVGYALQRSLTTFQSSQATADINGRSARAIQRVVGELIGARRSTLAPQPAPPFGSNSLEFEWPVGVAAGEPVWGPRRRIELELATGEADNGIDDDGDGLIDERTAVLLENPGTPDETRAVLVTGITELLEGELDNSLDDNGNGLIDETGLCFSLEAGNLVVRMTIQRVTGDGVVMVSTHEASVVVRNQWEP